MADLPAHPQAPLAELDRLFATPARSFAALGGSYAEAAAQWHISSISTYVDLAGKAHRAALAARTPTDLETTVEHFRGIAEDFAEQIQKDQQALVHLNKVFSESLEKFARETCADITRAA